MTRQLTFDLGRPDAMTRADFFVSPSNALTLQTVEAWDTWPGRKLVLVGPEGSGKTHLAHIWAALTGAVILPATDLGATDLGALAGRCFICTIW